MNAIAAMLSIYARDAWMDRQLSTGVYSDLCTIAKDVDRIIDGKRETIGELLSENRQLSTENAILNAALVEIADIHPRQNSKTPIVIQLYERVTELESMNERLSKELDNAESEREEWVRTADDYKERKEEYRSENDKLRDLVLDMYRWLSYERRGRSMPFSALHDTYGRMRELGFSTDELSQ